MKTLMTARLPLAALILSFASQAGAQLLDPYLMAPPTNNVVDDNFIGPLMPGQCRRSECAVMGIDPLTGQPVAAAVNAADWCSRTPTPIPCIGAENTDPNKAAGVLPDSDAPATWDANGNCSPKPACDKLEKLRAEAQKKALAEKKKAEETAYEEANARMFGGLSLGGEAPPAAGEAPGGTATPDAQSPDLTSRSTPEATPAPGGTDANGNLNGTAVDQSVIDNIVDNSPLLASNDNGGGGQEGGAAPDFGALGRLSDNLGGEVQVVGTGNQLAGIGPNPSAAQQLARHRVPPVDESLVSRLLKSMGFFDGSTPSTPASAESPLDARYRTTRTLGMGDASKTPQD